MLSPAWLLNALRGAGSLPAALAAAGPYRQGYDDEALACAAIAAFERQMEKTYGALVVEVGKAQAERFFPEDRAHARLLHDLPPGTVAIGAP